MRDDSWNFSREVIEYIIIIIISTLFELELLFSSHFPQDIFPYIKKKVIMLK